MAWILDNLFVVFIVGMGIASWLNAKRKKAAEAVKERQRLEAKDPSRRQTHGHSDGHSQAEGHATRQMYQPQSQVREFQDSRPTAVSADENTRRIQEQIRRKIAERRGGQADAPRAAERPDRGAQTQWQRPPAVPTVAQQRRVEPAPTVVRRREQELSPYAADARRAEEERSLAVILERQRALEEQMTALNARKAAAKGDAKAVWSTLQPVDVSSAVTGVGSHSGHGTGAATVTGSRGDHALLSELRHARSLRKAIVLREVLGTPVGLR